LEPGRERRLVTAALLLGMLLTAVEATAVGTAMPTAVAELGGVSRYSWVFSAYLLATTVTVPLFGKLADLYGRRRIYLVSVAIFLVGSALSGAARTLDQLIVYRAIQGVGAGGVAPVTVTVIGDIFSLRERGRMQGLFSGVWGLSSLLGPALGGVMTEALSWRWVFYFNIPFGIVSAVLLGAFLRERRERREHRLDVMGTVLLTAAVMLVMVVLLEGSEAWGWGSRRTLGVLAGAAVALGLFIWQESRTPEPMLPLSLFRNRLIAVANAGNAVIGALLFSAAAFVPMFAQGVLGGTAVHAGLTLAPVSVGWPIASVLSGRLLLRIGYRPLTVAGGAVGVAGALLLTRLDPGSGIGAIMAIMLLTGLGLGFMATPYLVAVQSAVSWRQRGIVTSSVQFFRTIGGAIAIAVLGSVLNRHLRAELGADANAILEPSLRAGLSAESLAETATALAGGLHAVFLAFAAAAVAAPCIALLFPRGTAESHAVSEREAGV